ncbi:MAG TPA: metallophosphoesterase [Thermomicrobiales bacterium]|jgi:hypothetical protein|nr:hypothetical protein [Chloroflexota bacterium]HQZ91367.1 metallophosphoesterase [Thermomicrobiales bacterium]HRA33175.1 metallophosphoesterase [Thermomicrobiales bacterium]
MDDLVRARFAVVTDLHIGSTTANRWHNRFLTDHPEQTAETAVAAINRDAPDFVIVLGDVSDNAREEELRLARAALDRLEAPWVVCRGNHDVTAQGDRAPFDRAFAGHAPVGLADRAQLPLPGGLALAVLDAGWGQVDGRWWVNVPLEQIEAVRAGVVATRPALLVVAGHFPFVDQAPFIRSMAADGRNAGTQTDGERTIAALAGPGYRTLLLTGHQHFHHIVASSTDEPAWLHVTTASLAEYPAEYRIITIDGRRVTIETRPAAPDLVAANPPEVDWVRGREADRERVWGG